MRLIAALRLWCFIALGLFFVGMVELGRPGLAVAVGLVALILAALRAGNPWRAEFGAVNNAASFWEQAEEELNRARRYERPLSLVRFTATSNAHAVTAAAQVGALLRREDAVASTGASVFVLLPEATSSAGNRFVKRVQACLPEQFSVTEVVAFPDHGLTLAALRVALTSSLQGVA